MGQKHKLQVGDLVVLISDKDYENVGLVLGLNEVKMWIVMWSEVQKYSRRKERFEVWPTSALVLVHSRSSTE